MNNHFRAVNNFLRSICSIFVVRNGGLVLHASGILRNGKTYIFFGPSGSGKSTVAKLSSNFTVLDDDSIFIERINPACPVREKFSNGVNYRASGRKLKGNFPIQGLYRLVKDKEIYLERVPSSRALCELFTIPGLLKDLAWHEILLTNFSKLIMETPCFDLHFRRDSSFWSCIDEYIK